MSKKPDAKSKKDRPPSRGLSEFAGNLKRWMTQKGYKSVQLAKLVNQSGGMIHYKTIDRILALENEPSTMTMEDISAVFGLEVWQMLIPHIPGSEPRMKQELLVEA